MCSTESSTNSADFLQHRRLDHFNWLNVSAHAPKRRRTSGVAASRSRVEYHPSGGQICGAGQELDRGFPKDKALPHAAECVFNEAEVDPLLRHAYCLSSSSGVVFSGARGGRAG